MCGTTDAARDARNAIFRLVGVNLTLQTRAAVLVRTLRDPLKTILQSAMPIFVLENR
jgi:hypothetical protein